MEITIIASIIVLLMLAKSSNKVMGLWKRITTNIGNFWDRISHVFAESMQSPKQKERPKYIKTFIIIILTIVFAYIAYYIAPTWCSSIGLGAILGYLIPIGIILFILFYLVLESPVISIGTVLIILAIIIICKLRKKRLNFKVSYLLNFIIWLVCSPVLRKRLNLKKWITNTLVVVSPSIMGPIIGIICGISIYRGDYIFPKNHYYSYVTSYDRIKLHGKDVRLENETDLRRILKMNVPACQAYGMVKYESEQEYKIPFRKELSTSFLDKLNELCEQDSEKEIENQLDFSKPHWNYKVNDYEGGGEMMGYEYCIPDSIYGDVNFLFTIDGKEILVEHIKK